LGSANFLRAIWVPRSFLRFILGSAKLFELISGSATSKRLKNTGLLAGVQGMIEEINKM
jgi:hypothetical protein